MILILGKSITGNSMFSYLSNKNIDCELLNTDEVTDYKYELVVTSPGIKKSNKVINAFIELGVEVISDLEYFFRNEDFKYILVTGSNGKTTVVEMIAHCLSKCMKVVACGNNGIPLSSVFNNGNELYIIEVSSFQLSYTSTFNSLVSIITNVENCHMDYHDSFDDYKNTKLKVLNNSKHNIINENIDYKGKACKLVFDDIDCYNKKIVIEVCNYFNINQNINSMLENFKKPKYRFEYITYNIVNDSKSTNPFSTYYSLKNIKRDIVLICGGYYKGEKYDILDYLTNIKCVYVFGDAKDYLYQYFYNRNIIVDMFDNLDDIVEIVNINNYIVFSPMHSSFDQFRNYIERGEKFNSLIKKKLIN